MTRLVLAGNNLAAVHVLDLMLEFVPPADLLVLAPANDAADWHPSLRDAARSRSVPVLQPDDVNAPEVIETLQTFGPDHFFSVYYTQIFKPPLLRALRSAPVNFHPSLLPRHRGTAPIIWAIADGDTKTGLTVHLIDEGIDTGEILYQHSIPIHPDDTGFSMHNKCALLARATAADLLRRIDAGTPFPSSREQVGDSSYHSKRDPRLNHLRWADDAERVRNIVRALAPPLPGAYSTVNGERLVFERLGRATADGRTNPPGMVTVRPGQTPLVWTGSGPLLVERCLIGGKRVSGRELAASGLVREGDILE